MPTAASGNATSGSERGPALAGIAVRSAENPKGTQARSGGARASVAVPEEADSRRASRRDLAQDPAPDQGRAALDPAGSLPRRVLHPAAHPGGRVLALGRRDRPAAFLSALGRAHGARP